MRAPFGRIETTSRSCALYQHRSGTLISPYGQPCSCQFCSGYSRGARPDSTITARQPYWSPHWRATQLGDSLSNKALARYCRYSEPEAQQLSHTLRLREQWNRGTCFRTGPRRCGLGLRAVITLRLALSFAKPYLAPVTDFRFGNTTKLLRVVIGLRLPLFFEGVLTDWPQHLFSRKQYSTAGWHKHCQLL